MLRPSSSCRRRAPTTFQPLFGKSHPCSRSRSDSNLPVAGSERSALAGLTATSSPSRNVGGTNPSEPHGSWLESLPSRPSTVASGVDVHSDLSGCISGKLPRRSTEVLQDCIGSPSANRRNRRRPSANVDWYATPPHNISPSSSPKSSPSGGSSDNGNGSIRSDMTEPPPALAHLPRQLPNMYTKDLPRQSSGREEKSTSTAAEVVRSAKDALRVATCSQARPSKFQVNLREPETSSRQRSTNTASRIHQAREQVIGSNARTLDWSLYVQHEKISCIRVQLSAARDKTVKSIGGEDVPACLIEVCAEGHPADGAARGHKLIRCSGSLVPRRSRLHVNWLGRKGACPEKPDPQVRVGCAPVGKPEARPGTPSWAVLRGECGSDRASGPPYTVAQAVLATLAAIGGLFGMIIIELDAEDNGSGKLVQYYTQLGFSVVVQVKGFDVEMEAPLATVAQNAPEDWIRGLMPEDFDAWGWLNPRSNRRRW